MKILVIGSCGKKKRTQSPDEPTCKDLTSNQSLGIWQEKLSSLTVKARDMYTGNQSRELTHGVDILREIDGVDVRYFIISAGFGLLSEEELVPPYDCSFSTMSKMQILNRSRILSINADVIRASEEGFDIAYLALGKNYLTSLEGGWQSNIDGAIIAFEKSLIGRKYAKIPAGNQTVKAFSNRGYKIHGAAGFKGDLLRILAEYALNCGNPTDELRSWTDPPTLRETILSLGGLE